MSLLRRLFTARPQTSRQSSSSSDLTPTRLPDGSEHDPIWNPLDDDKMAQGMNLKQPDFGTHTSSVVRRGEVTLRVPGLFAEDGSLRENPTEQAVDIIETRGAKRGVSWCTKQRNTLRYWRDRVCATGDGSTGSWHTANSMSLRSLSNKRGQELPSNGTIPASLPSSVSRKRPADLISSTPSRRTSSRLSASSYQLTSRAQEQFRLTRETPDAAARKTTSSHPSKSSLMRSTPNAATRKPHTCHRAESSHSPSKSSRSPHPSRSSVGATSTRQAQEAMDLADMVPSLLGQPSQKSQHICSSSKKLPIELALSELDPMELLDYFSDNHSVEGGSADASEGRADAQMDEPPSLNDVSDEVVRWGRSSVLKQLNLPAASSRLFDGVHQETRGDILRHLRRTTEGVENVSALILGPKGAGYIRKVTAPNLAKKCNNFCDGLRYLLHLLRRTRPGVEGEARREAQAQPVLFVLHDFEGFALRSKQSLLYSLFDLMQSDDAQMAVIGLTARNDAVDLLEKRVLSRFSQHIIFCPTALSSNVVYAAQLHVG
ncbi:MAG: hypothetical protein SGPRY_002241 [Prymnesium sp.]